jgi:GGDEF domain-containing protein
MVWYVALVAILNLGLGYALAVYLGIGRLHPAASLVGLGQSLREPAPQDVNLTAEYGGDVAATEAAEMQPSSDTLTADSATAAAPPAVDTDPATGLTTREHIEKQLANLTASYAAAQPATVALVEITQAADGSDEVEERLLRGIAGTVRDLLAEMHTAGRYSNQQFLLLLPQDDLQHATQRAEQVRQRVAATQFVADGQPLQATVTCALTQVAASHTATNLLEFLEETLEEAKRFGGNRTFMHDGTSPTPVVPPELNVAAQTCAI